MFKCPQHLIVYKVLKLDWQTDKISFVGSAIFPKFWSEKDKATTLNEPPITFCNNFTWK